jgi:hypothetical protein
MNPLTPCLVQAKTTQLPGRSEIVLLKESLKRIQLRVQDVDRVMKIIERINDLTL